MNERRIHDLGLRLTALLMTLLLVFGAAPLAPVLAQEPAAENAAAEALAQPESPAPETDTAGQEGPAAAAGEDAEAAEEKAGSAGTAESVEAAGNAAAAETAPAAAAAEAPPAARSLTVLHTNDMHGALVSDGKSTIGADEVGGIFGQLPADLLLDAGDATQGGTLAALSQGADVITLMNAAGYDAMALGNHEFDYGQEILFKNAESADFPMLSANTVFKDTRKPILEGRTYAGGTKTNNGQYIMLERKGIKVGIFGVTTPETATKTNPNGIKNIAFEDPIEVSKKMIAALKQEGAELIICLAHLGVDPSTAPENRSTGLAEAIGAVGGLDIIIDGHSHTVYGAQKTNGVLIQQTGSSSKNAGVLTFTLENDSRTDDGHLMKAAEAFTKYTPVPEITALAKKLVDANAGKLKPVIGNTRTALWGGTVYGINIARVGETNLGSLISDSMAAEAKKLLTEENSPYKDLPVVALENGGGVRDTIKRGKVTVGDSINVLPFGNTLAFKIVTPAILYEALENGVSKVVSQDPETGLITGQGGCFPQISGMSFTYDPTKQARDSKQNIPGSRVTAIYLDGGSEALRRDDHTTEIVLCSNDYELAGGDGYDMLTGLTSAGEGGVLEEVFRNYLTKLTAEGGGSFLVPPSYGRIKTAGAYVPKPYSAVITVTGPESMGSLAGKTVEFQIDGGPVQTAVLDEKGQLKFDVLPDGPHGVRIGDADDVLIDNYTGFGTTAAGNTPVSAAVKTTLLISEKPQPQPVKPDEPKEAKAANPQTGAGSDRPAAAAALGLALLTGGVAVGAWRKRRQKIG